MSELSTRSPICATLGHVDHGKTSVLDRIRNTSIVNTEAGKITQSIGASIVPLSTIKSLCKDILQTMKISFTIPGLLFIDTPGHAAFTNLRKRGGNIADIAVLVVDINEGFMPQTIEAIEILKSFKTPFIIAANKVDLVPGWKSKKEPISKSILQQSQQVQQYLDKKIYEIVGKLYEVAAMQAERFDRISDMTKQIIIVPTSAYTGEGIPEVLLMIAGLAQKYLDKNLKFDVKGAAKGTILEVKHDRGLGTNIDVIVYNGTLKVNDTLVIGTLDRPLITRVKALLEPAPLSELRDRKTKFNSVKQVTAASGVKICAPDIDDVIAGMPVRSCKKSEAEKVASEIEREVKEVMINTDKEGIVIKADTLGSLEALHCMLREKGIKVIRLGVGNITKKDIIEAEANYSRSPLQSVVLGFNIKDASNLCNDHVHVITNQVIYKLLEDFEAWQQKEKKNLERAMLSDIVFPCKIKILPGYVFRQSNPAICGIEVLHGKLQSGVKMMKQDAKEITKVSGIQVDKENVSELDTGKQAAVSFDNIIIGRHVNEGEILFSCIPEEHFKKLKNLKHLLSEKEKELIKEIAALMRKVNPVWGV